MTPPFTMIGNTVAKVVESRDKDFPVGTRIISMLGWVKKGKVNLKKNKQSSGIF